MSEPLPLRRVIEKILSGAIRIPGFQRKFVWEPSRAALLMDSIYKGYPFGSVLLWRTRSVLKTEKALGGFMLPNAEAGYPVDYVLDGQQRLTSIFATFQTELPAKIEDPEIWLPIFYDFEAEEDAQESRFIALASSDSHESRYFPLRVFFDAVQFARAMSALPEARQNEIVRVQERFKEALIPAETFETEDRGRVAIVFERVNRMGVELDMFELLTAWTWSEEFDLQDRFNELAGDLSEFGFEDAGSDHDLLLRCCAAILKGDPSPASMIDINGAEFRTKFEIVTKSLERAVDFLRDQLQVRHVKFLPYSAQLIPLAAYFSVDQSASVSASDSAALKRWFWRSTFAHRYSGNPGRNIRADVDEALKLRHGAQSDLDGLAVSVDSSFFTQNNFSARTVASKALILLLAQQSPLSFLSGQRIFLDQVLSEPNRKEFHHCAPRAWVRDNRTNSFSRVNSLANYAMISRVENREISDLPPSAYRAMMQGDLAAIDKSAFLPASLWSDDVERFLDERAELLAAEAARLVA